MSLNKRIMKIMKECQLNYCNLDCIFYFRHLIIIITIMPEEALNIAYSYHISALQNFLDNESFNQYIRETSENCTSKKDFSDRIVKRSIYLSIFVCMSGCLPVFLSVCLSDCLPSCPSIYLYIIWWFLKHPKWALKQCIH